MKDKNLLMSVLISIGLFAIILLILSSCGFNKQIIDLDYSFNKAIIENVGEIDIKSWKDYENSDMIQVTATDGKVYLTHSSNVILIYDR